jgi:hypothetical protein
VEDELYALYDVRTGRRCSRSEYLSPEQAAAAIDLLRELKDRSDEIDIHELIPYLGFVKLTPDTQDSNPGDIIDGRGTA